MGICFSHVCIVFDLRTAVFKREDGGRAFLVGSGVLAPFFRTTYSVFGMFAGIGYIALSSLPIFSQWMPFRSIYVRTKEVT